MPTKLTKNKDGTYKVSTPNMVHGKRMTLDKAKKQMRLLNAIEHGYKPK